MSPEEVEALLAENAALRAEVAGFRPQLAELRQQLQSSSTLGAFPQPCYND
jgi:hypothetical protein